MNSILEKKVANIEMRLSFSIMDQNPPIITGNIPPDQKIADISAAVSHTSSELMTQLATIGLSEACAACNLLGALVESHRRSQVSRALIITERNVVKLLCPVLDMFHVKKMNFTQLSELGCHNGFVLTIFDEKKVEYYEHPVLSEEIADMETAPRS